MFSMRRIITSLLLGRLGHQERQRRQAHIVDNGFTIANQLPIMRAKKFDKQKRATALVAVRKKDGF